MEGLLIVGLMVLAVIAVLYFIRRGKGGGSGKVTTSGGGQIGDRRGDGSPERRKGNEIDPS